MILSYSQTHVYMINYHVRTGLPSLKQYQTGDNVPYSRTQDSELAGREPQTRNPSIPSLTFCQFDQLRSLM